MKRQTIQLGDGYLGWNPGAFYLQATLPSLSICCFETGYHYVAEAGLEPAILLSQSPKYWDYRHV